MELPTPRRIRVALAVLLWVLVASFAPRFALAAPATQQTAPCYAAAMTALTKQGSLYSQGGALADDPIDYRTGEPYPRTGPESFDCSGLVWWAYAQAGVSIGTSTYQQLNNGVRISCTLDNLNGANTTCWALGDLAFLRYSGGQHVAIYVGAGQFMDCYNHLLGCFRHNPKNDSFYRQNWYQSRRIVSGCENAVFNPGSVYIPVSSAPPLLEEVPAIVMGVSLGLPWACGACAGEQTALVPEPEPEISWHDLGTWIQWLGVQLWNRAALPIICWMLTIASGLLQAAETAINVVFVAGINSLWRILVVQLLNLRDMFYAAWSMLEGLRLTIWNVNGTIQQTGIQLQNLIQFVLALFDFVRSMFLIFTQLLTDLSQILGYFLALFLGTIPAVVTGVANPVQPPQVAILTNNFLFQALRDTLQAFADSKLGWVWLSLIALFYVRFAMWLVDEFSEVNQ